VNCTLRARVTRRWQNQPYHKPLPENPSRESQSPANSRKKMLPEFAGDFISDHDLEGYRQSAPALPENWPLINRKADFLT
jgi:hypothetical protein